MTHKKERNCSDHNVILGDIPSDYHGSGESLTWETSTLITSNQREKDGALTLVVNINVFNQGTKSNADRKLLVNKEGGTNE